jgi:hypothetical protein
VEEKPFPIYIRNPSGTENLIYVYGGYTVSQLVLIISCKFGLPYNSINLYLSGSRLDLNRTLREYNVYKGNIIYLVHRIV